jgi:hypothetical protein
MANLVSNVDMGAGTRPFKSGGRGDRGAHTGGGLARRLFSRCSYALLRFCSIWPSEPCITPLFCRHCCHAYSSLPCAGRGTTFWNLYLSEKRAVQLPECGWGPLLNFIGSFGGGQVGGQWGGFSKGMPALVHTSKNAEHPAFMMLLNQPAAATARIAARPAVPGVGLAGGAAGRWAALRPARRPGGRAQAAGGPGCCRQALNYSVMTVTLATLHLAILDAAAPPPLDRPPPRAVPCWALPRSPVPGGLPASP